MNLQVTYMQLLMAPAVPAGLGRGCWRCPKRIWLHTDTWDHPAAVRVYQRAGFETYAVRDQPAALL